MKQSNKQIINKIRNKNISDPTQYTIYQGDTTSNVFLLRRYLQWGQIIKTLFTIRDKLLRRYLQRGQIIKTLFTMGTNY